MVHDATMTDASSLFSSLRALNFQELMTHKRNLVLYDCVKFGRIVHTSSITQSAGVVVLLGNLTH